MIEVLFRVVQFALFAIVIYLFISFFYVFDSGIVTQLKNGSLEEFRKTNSASFIVLPEDTQQITSVINFQFDTNFRYVKCTVRDASVELEDLISQSVLLNDRPFPENSLWVPQTHVTTDGMLAFFDGDRSESPGWWWDKDFSTFNRQAYYAADDGKPGGDCHGYFFLLNSQRRELRVLYWSQQHRTVAETEQELLQ